jgi:hypothetical protein
MRESLPNVGEVLTNSADWQCKCSLRGKRSDPLQGANARSKAGAVLLARCWCEMQTLQACQHPSGEPPIGRWSRTRRRGLTRKIPLGSEFSLRESKRPL